MSAPLIRAIGEITIGDSAAQTSMPVNLPPRKIGDILFVHAQGQASLPNNVGGPVAPPGATTLFVFDSTNAYHRWYAIRVLDSDAALTLQGGTDQKVDTWTTQAWTVTNVSPSGMWYDHETEAIDPSPRAVPAVTVNGIDRLVVHFFRGHQALTDPGGIVGPAEYDDTYPERAANLGGRYYRNSWRTAPTNVSMSSATYDNLASSADWIMSISIIGIDDTPLPALPQPGQLRLNCATSYTTWITGPDYRTTIEMIGWRSLNWSRILDEASNAQVVVPDILGGVSCCISHGGLEPWEFGLLIERNDTPVWSGPIIQIGRDPEANTTTISASDILKRYEKRVATRDVDVNWVNTDAGTALAAVINTHTHLITDAWYVPCPTVFTGAPVTRKIVPRELTKASDVISDLLGSAVDAFVMNGVIYVWEPNEGWRYFDGFKRRLDGPYNSNYDYTYSLFTAEAFTKLPRWDINGMGMANYVAIPAADSGQFGYREVATAESFDSQARFGVLDHAESSTLNMPENTAPSVVRDVLQARANTYRDLHAYPPVVISGGSLAQGAPIDVDNLRPGSIWLMDIFDACYGKLRVANRLKSVEVSVSIGSGGGIIETISPTMFPPGFEGGEL